MTTSRHTSKAAAELQAAQLERLRMSLSQAANGAFGVANILDAAADGTSRPRRQSLQRGRVIHAAAIRRASSTHRHEPAIG
jgi:hypothetical protein